MCSLPCITSRKKKNKKSTRESTAIIYSDQCFLICNYATKFQWKKKSTLECKRALNAFSEEIRRRSNHVFKWYIHLYLSISYSSWKIRTLDFGFYFSIVWFVFFLFLFFVTSIPGWMVWCERATKLFYVTSIWFPFWSSAILICCRLH